MNLFDIYPQLDQEIEHDILQYKRVQIKNSGNNSQLFGFDKCYKKRWRSLFKNFTIPYQQIHHYGTKELNYSCDCNECGGKVKKKILICKKELRDYQFSPLNQRSRALPKLSIQPQTVRLLKKDKSLIGSSPHFSIFLINFYVINIRNKLPREIPVIQLIKAQNLMKKISRPNKIEFDLKIKMNQQTECQLSKLQKNINENNQILGKSNENLMQMFKEIDIIKQRDLLKNKSFKQSSNRLHYRIKTDVSTYYFPNQSKNQIYIPNLSHLENQKKNSLSIFESKTSRVLIRSEKFNLKQSLTQRLLSTYLKKSISNNNSNSKQVYNKKQ
ncbi:unnamed protein product [Paramecium primaurelia]|uniref:Uncharacterized protein n=1 Tax=Paramecium primaurelia TaxID=5886 RepID=A0A8S1LHH9_PARPR|nr:unnamed protein product [Paramecium primaurelia]